MSNSFQHSSSRWWTRRRLRSDWCILCEAITWVYKECIKKASTIIDINDQRYTTLSNIPQTVADTKMYFCFYIKVSCEEEIFIFANGRNEIWSRMTSLLWRSELPIKNTSITRHLLITNVPVQWIFSTDKFACFDCDSSHSKVASKSFNSMLRNNHSNHNRSAGSIVSSVILISDSQFKVYLMGHSSFSIIYLIVPLGDFK